MDISGAERLLFHCRDNAIHLMAIGGHDVVEHYCRTGNIEAELRRVRPLPPDMERLAASGFFTFDVEEEWRQFANEADPSWLTYLDGEQAKAVDRILARVAHVSENPRAWCFVLLLGGPGTGKTSILINLFSRALEQDYMPEIAMEDQVVEYVHTAGAQNVDGHRVSVLEAGANPDADILLVDDPQSIREIRHAKSLAQLRRYKAVIVAVDPLQLATDATDGEVATLTSGSGAEAIELHTCYRQKAVVGRAAKKALDAIAASSPFFREDKKEAFAGARARLTKTSNSFTFPNPAGRAKVYPAASLDDVRAEVRRLQRAPGLWTHTASYLIAQDDESLGDLPRGWKTCLRELKHSSWVKMSEAQAVKGVEFQHVVLIVSETLFLQLENGFEGATRALYNTRRLYRIPLTRAKDSITVFVVPSAAR
jgi:hypothetical protein